VAVGLFNLVMVAWHLPGPYDLAENNSVVHIWVMHASFFTAGVLFWLQFIPSPPFRIRMPLASQAAALLATNFVMIGIAMALSIFVNGSVYPVYAHVPGVTPPPFADQQIGAAILWVCGDFWALPTMIIIVRRLIHTDGSITAALEGVLNRGAARGGWTTGRPAAGVLRTAAGSGPAAAPTAVQRPSGAVQRPSGDGES
jgi:cytochrome c oxidase assembly factor CtaG